MSKLENVYIKVTGAFPEMGSAASMSAEKIADRVAPYFDHAVKEFTPKRVMYGSDWPLVSMNGGGDKGWGL
jgi:predicted TIM-barrel fold metal-dependent hydrolase